jgi:hypothetical protein
VCAALVFVAAISMVRSVPFGYLMVRAAVFLSGNSSPFSWDTGS